MRKIAGVVKIKVVVTSIKHSSAVWRVHMRAINALLQASSKPREAVLTTVVSAVTKSDIPFFAFLLVSDQPICSIFVLPT